MQNDTTRATGMPGPQAHVSAPSIDELAATLRAAGGPDFDGRAAQHAVGVRHVALDVLDWLHFFGCAPVKFSAWDAIFNRSGPRSEAQVTSRARRWERVKTRWRELAVPHQLVRPTDENTGFDVDPTDQNVCVRLLPEARAWALQIADHFDRIDEEAEAEQLEHERELLGPLFSRLAAPAPAEAVTDLDPAADLFEPFRAAKAVRS